MISKELKEFVFQIMVEERMKNLGLRLFLELQVEVNYILLLLLFLVGNILVKNGKLLKKKLLKILQQVLNWNQAEIWIISKSFITNQETLIVSYSEDMFFHFGLKI